MGIQVITGVSTAALAEALADRFAVPADDPFAGEMVVVPTRGIERYLTQTIADRAGISANIEFPSPRELLERITGDDDPWRPDRLVWPLLATIDASLGEAWAEPLAAHLRDDPDRRRSDRRYALAHRLADLFDRYGMERPQMLRDWGAGAATGVPDDLAWQYQLWRAVRARIGSAPLQQPIDPGGLPDRLAVFGPTRLPERLLEALDAVAQQREVGLYLPVASPALWDCGDWPAPAATRKSDTTRSLARHPLLRALGRDARELRQRLGHEGSAPEVRLGVQASGVLGQLQAGIAANSESSLRDAEPDASLQIHACHGGLRQVEALREVILTLLHDDPTLQPRDILIMAPDLDTYAPLLAAVFGDPDPRIRDLRLSIADRTPAQHNPVLLALDALLALLHGRMRRSDVLDLLKLDPVHARFGLSIDDVLRIEELAEAANVRWGLGAEHRTAVGGGSSDLGTWSWAMDRMALGTALTDDPAVIVGDRLPLPDIGSGDVGPLGRSAVFLQRLSELLDQVQGTRTVAEWNALLQGAISTFTEVGFADAWQEARARGAVESFAALAGHHASAVQLSLADIRHMLAGVMAGRPTRAGFRLGGMTACQLEPMRSVPYRVIALLGLDDGAFPRRSGRDGDDVLLREPRIGERDPRSEDRQLLLDAIMAAEQHLIITYTGRDERTNEERHPAVPVAELLELLPARPGTVQHHPLQPFDPRNFALDGPVSHDEAALSAALVSLEPRHAPGPRLGEIPPKPSDATEDVHPATMADLVRFLKDPLSDYLRRRFGLYLDRSAEPPNERVPLTLGGLDAWTIGEGMLRTLEASDDVAALEQQAARSGTVPPGDLGAVCLETVREKALKIAGKADRDRSAAPAEAREVPLPWQPGSTIRIGGIHGHTVVRTTYSSRKPAQLLQLWPELLCLRIAYPDTPWRWFLFTGSNAWYATAPQADASRTHLEHLLALYCSGAAALLPVTATTGHAYVSGLQDKNGSRARGLGRASRAWDDDYAHGDNRTAAARLIFGVDSEFADLLAEPPHAAEDWYGAAAPTRFEAIARSIWEPVTAHASGRRPPPAAAALGRPRKRGGRA